MEATASNSRAAKANMAVVADMEAAVEVEEEAAVVDTTEEIGDLAAAAEDMVVTGTGMEAEDLVSLRALGAVRLLCFFFNIKCTS